MCLEILTLTPSPHWVNDRFGFIQEKEDPQFTPAVEEPITTPIVKDVYRYDAERLYLAFRFQELQIEKLKFYALLI